MRERVYLVQGASVAGSECSGERLSEKKGASDKNVTFSTVLIVIFLLEGRSF